MWKDRLSREYEEGVEHFIQFALSHSNNPECLRCPCKTCGNLAFHTPTEIRNHLFRRGIDKSYNIQTWHGEETLIRDRTSVKSSFAECPDDDVVNNTIDMVHDAFEHCSHDPKSLKSLLEDTEKPLYPGCTEKKDKIICINETLQC